MEKDKFDRIRKKYPIGTTLRLISMADKQAPPVGMYGKVMYVDDIGTIHMAWQNSSTLGLIEGVDEWEVIENEK